MDGLLVVDKPAGLTSHDVVARVRRILNERAIGHTGTLDPAATGVLPLVLGRATRLARFLSASSKTYEAVITLGISTDTADAAGAPIGTAFPGPLPTREAIDGALGAFRGSFLQEPPAYSAKKIGGKRSYKLARAASAAAVNLRPSSGQPPSSARPTSVPVVVHRLELTGIDGPRVTLLVDCSAGFYVRSLAHDLGARLGTGAHLTALRRSRSGEWTLADAIALDSAERAPERAAAHVIPVARMLMDLPAVVLTQDGVVRAAHGRDIGPLDVHYAAGFETGDSTFAPHVRLLNPMRELVGIGRPAGTPGLLHPFVVLV